MKIPVYIRSEGAITQGENWIEVQSIDTPYGDFDYDESLVKFATPVIYLTEAMKSVDWRADLEQHFRGNFYQTNPEYVAENNQGIADKTAVYDLREIGGEEYWFISYLGIETTICLEIEH